MNHFHAETILKINLKALSQNYQLILSNISSEAECAAVVKCDAFSLGVSEIAKKLSHVGCSKFFVSNIDEGILLRTLSLTDEIYILHGIFKGQEEQIYQHNLIPVLNCPEQAELWRNYAKKKQRRMPAVINIDTGTNRLGMSKSEAKLLFESEIIRDLKIVYLMSDLAASEDANNPLNEHQYMQVSGFHKFAGNIPISLSNSAGVFLHQKYHFDLVRVGAAIYGLSVSPTMPELNKVVSLTSSIIQIRHITGDEYIGPGKAHKLTKGMKIAIVPNGYADFMPHSASNKGFCYIADVKTPILGEIQMDTFIVDATHVPAKELYVGAEVEIIGDNVSIEDVAAYSSSTNYEILLSLRQKCKRIYIE